MVLRNPAGEAEGGGVGVVQTLVFPSAASDPAVASCCTGLAASFHFSSGAGRAHDTTPVPGVLLGTHRYVADTTTRNHSTFFRGIRSSSVPVTLHWRHLMRLQAAVLWWSMPWSASWGTLELVRGPSPALSPSF